MKLIQFEEKCKMIYDEKIKYKVVRLFGEDSEIFTAYVNGEKISEKIKINCSERGSKTKKLRDKILLSVECRRQEKKFEESLQEVSI